MQILDNVNNTVRNDLKKIIHKGSKVSIAAACFSIYAYKELKEQLEEIDELKFVFTSPTFTTEKTPNEKLFVAELQYTTTIGRQISC